MRKLCFTVAVVFFIVFQVWAQSTAPDSAEIDRRVESMLAKMTLEEKIDMLGGVDNFYTHDVPRLGVPRFKMADGPIGVRNYGPSTTMAAGIALAATWNPELAARVGTQIGRDARARGVHILLAPGVNIHRAPMCGRNFEYFGEDPFLASRIAVGYIEGVQSQGVSATIKHFLGNNQEYDRHNVDSAIDERTMREIYLVTFESAVKEAHVGAIMNAYNLTNGVHMTQNTYADTDILKKEWGFDGILMSDWSATYDGVAAANAGLDLEMPSPLHMNRETLLPAVQQGNVSVAVIDDKVRRILREGVRFGWLDRDQTDSSIPLNNPEGAQAALQSAREAIVLLKNQGDLLPLDKTKLKSLAIIGPDAYPAVPDGGGSARVVPFSAVSFREGLTGFLGSAVQVSYTRGLPTLEDMAKATNFVTAKKKGQPGLQAEYFRGRDLEGVPAATRTEEHVDFGPGSKNAFPDNTHSGRWTGYFVPRKSGPYEIVVQSPGEDGGAYRLYVDNKIVLDDWEAFKAVVGFTRLSLSARPHKVVLEEGKRQGRHELRLRLGIVPVESLVTPEAREIAARADVVVLAVGFDAESETESTDRTFRLPPGQDELIEAVAAANKNTIVVITSGGGVDMNAWLHHIPAVLEAWYPGQEGGTALAEILFGAVNPSGRLPATFPARWEDSPAHDSYYSQQGEKRVEYKEGVFVGYRGYDRAGTEPLFPFGYGLSYTTFAYSHLSISPETTTDGNVVVSFDVTNTGTREGAEVAQVYVGEPHPAVPRPPKELKTFAKISLRPGETHHVIVSLNRRSLSYYDVQAKDWHADAGEFDVFVGRSSRQIELQGKFTLEGAPPGHATAAAR